MSKHHPNPNLARRYRTYSVTELCTALGVHYNTVRSWVRLGLSPIDAGWKMYFRGEDVRAFLIEKRERAKRPCPAGMMFCVVCQAPRPPAGALVEYKPFNSSRGALVGICPSCQRLMHRFTPAAKVAEFIAQIPSTRSEA